MAVGAGAAPPSPRSWIDHSPPRQLAIAPGLPPGLGLLPIPSEGTIMEPAISVQDHNYTYMFNFEQVTFQSRASSGYCQFTKVEVLSTLSDGCEGEMSDSNSDKWVGRAVTRKGLKIGGKSKASKLPEFSQITSFPPAHKKQCPPCQPNNCTNSSEPIILRGNEGSIKFFKPRFKCKCI